MPPAITDLLFEAGGQCFEKYGVACRRIAPIGHGGEELKETFSRADASTVASYVDRDGFLRRALANVLRVDWPLVSGVRVPHLLLETGETNGALQSETLGTTWVPEQLSVSSNADIGLENTLTADRLIEDSSLNEHRLSQTGIAIGANQTLCFSAFVHKASTRGWCILRVERGGSPGDAFRAWFNLATGTTGTLEALGGGSVVASGVIDWSQYYWRPWVVGAVAGGATTVAARIYMASADATVGYQGDGASWISIAGVQHETGANFPTSYIKTTTAAVTRAPDRLEFPFYAHPQAMTVYVHFLERAHPPWGTYPRIWQIGAAADSDPRLFLYKLISADIYRIELDPGVNISSVDLNPVLGDRIELRAFLNAGGNVQLHGAKNGGTEVSGSVSSTTPLSAAWSSPTLVSVASIGGGTQGSVNLRSLKIVRGGPWTMDEMRNL